ncbi:MAG: ribosome silencing factor [Lentisphaeria bacterium]|nr:ribosome silencing factor [Lentisphaeria bacterium]
MDSTRPVGDDAEALARRCVEICVEHKGENITLYDLQGTSMLADYFVFCTANSTPHIRALAEHIRVGLSAENALPRAREGEAVSQWVIMDYGVVIVHIMDAERRDFYKIEELLDPEQAIYRSEELDADA